MLTIKAPNYFNGAILVSLVLIVSKFYKLFWYFFSASNVDFKQVNTSWEGSNKNITHLAFTCSKSTIETQKDGKHVQS